VSIINNVFSLSFFLFFSLSEVVTFLPEGVILRVVLSHKKKDLVYRINCKPVSEANITYSKLFGVHPSTHSKK
jgi:hypothetical protein